MYEFDRSHVGFRLSSFILEISSVTGVVILKPFENSQSRRRQTRQCRAFVQGQKSLLISHFKEGLTDKIL
jgi:hypothetical protein